MGLTKEKARENLIKLTERFKEELEADKVKDYNEEATKTAFIQPLLKDILGWDVTNRDEVSPEERTSRGRVDYGLKIGGRIKIFVEAKPPKIDLSKGKPVEQAIRYGYSRKDVHFILLTDFEEFRLYDVTIKPDQRNLNKGLKIDLKWDRYVKEFDKIWLISKESVANGELDKLLLAKPKDRLSVDKAILDDLKNWRESLSRDIYKNNKQLFQSNDPEKDAAYLKEITQKILDRIIFMRSCEDRGLVHRNELKDVFAERTKNVGTTAMVFLKEEFKHYNITFDSDLFHPQEWEDALEVDFDGMRKIIEETYNPYQFDAIPIEVLGYIYEQYLGYTLKITEHQVRYELKPDVRKAGGVYYTPEYIVDYIVKNTVGKLLEELSLAKIKKLRILDPACGSGSFLIRAYDEMLAYYRKQKKSKKKSDISHPTLDFEVEKSENRLTIYEKSEILKSHIFGVDIDDQAVEVTKLSLMLKMLEGEFGIIPGRSLLPALDKNIRCGNSLISGDTLELKEYFNDDWYKVKPFNWEKEFKEIMADEGGFDVVIGNPPYVFARDEGFTEKEKRYFYQKYHLTQYQLNTYIMFTEKSFHLLKPKGRFGFIIPNNWLTIDTTSEFRKFIIKNTRQAVIVNIYDRVFEHADVDTSLLLFSKSGDRKIACFEMLNGKINRVSEQDSKNFTANNNYIINYNLLMAKGKTGLCEKIEHGMAKLAMLAMVKAGINAYEVGKGKPKQTEEMKKSRVYHSKQKIDDRYFRYLDGKDVQRYLLDWGNKYIRYGDNLAAPRTFDLFNEERLLIRQIPSKPPYSILGAYVNETIINDRNSMIVKKLKNIYSIKFLLALINSKLMSFWFFYKFGKLQRKTFPQFKIKELSIFPIHPIDFHNTFEKQFHDNIVTLVDVMLDLNKKLQVAKGAEKERIS